MRIKNYLKRKLNSNIKAIFSSFIISYMGLNRNSSINRGNSAHHIQNRCQVSGVLCQEGILEELKPESRLGGKT